MQIGDTIFLKQGIPAVIIDKKEDGSFILEKEGENFERVRNAGFINGLTPSDKAEFSDIVLQIKKIKDPREQYVALQSKIEELKIKNTQLISAIKNDTSLDLDSLERYKQQEITNKNVMKYLKAELFHLSSSENINPKIYSIDSTML